MSLSFQGLMPSLLSGQAVDSRLRGVAGQGRGGVVVRATFIGESLQLVVSEPPQAEVRVLAFNTFCNTNKCLPVRKWKEKILKNIYRPTEDKSWVPINLVEL